MRHTAMGGAVASSPLVCYADARRKRATAR